MQNMIFPILFCIFIIGIIKNVLGIPIVKQHTDDMIRKKRPVTFTLRKQMIIGLLSGSVLCHTESKKQSLALNTREKDWPEFRDISYSDKFSFAFINIIFAAPFQSSC